MEKPFGPFNSYGKVVKLGGMEKVRQCASMSWKMGAGRGRLEKGPGVCYRSNKVQ